MTIHLPFSPRPSAKADFRPGVLYDIDGGDGQIYYGQVPRGNGIGFFRFRSEILKPEQALAAGIMSRFGVNRPSIGRALRAGVWRKVGRFDPDPALERSPLLVQWPVGTQQVSIWQGNSVVRETVAHDPEIQALEVISDYDAADHVPSRLVADYTQPDDAWKVGGSVWRYRRQKEDFARRFPEMPWHQLPHDWVPT